MCLKEVWAGGIFPSLVNPYAALRASLSGALFLSAAILRSILNIQNFKKNIDQGLGGALSLKIFPQRGISERASSRSAATSGMWKRVAGFSTRCPAAARRSGCPFGCCKRV